MEEDIKRISGSTATEIWEQVANDLEGKDVLEYHAVLLEQDRPPVTLQIEIDLGGGFEGGFEETTFIAPVQVQNDFRFTLHHASFLDKAGKFLGMEDKDIGYPEFDKEFIIKTNDEEKVKFLLADEELRSFFQTLQNFNLHITHPDVGDYLELEIEDGITDTAELQAIYDAFRKVLISLHQL